MGFQQVIMPEGVLVVKLGRDHFWISCHSHKLEVADARTLRFLSLTKITSGLKQEYRSRISWVNWGHCGGRSSFQQ